MYAGKNAARSILLLRYKFMEQNLCLINRQLILTNYLFDVILQKRSAVKRS